MSDNEPISAPAPTETQQTPASVRARLVDLRTRLDTAITALPPAETETAQRTERRRTLMAIRSEYQALLTQIRTMRNGDPEIATTADGIHSVLTAQLPDAPTLAPTPLETPAPAPAPTPAPVPQPEPEPEPAAPAEPEGPTYPYPNPTTTMQRVANAWAATSYYAGKAFGKVRDFFAQSPMLGGVLATLTGGFIASHLGSAGATVQQTLTTALTPGPLEGALTAIATAERITITRTGNSQQDMTALTTRFNTWKRTHGDDPQAFIEAVVAEARRPNRAKTTFTMAEILTAARRLVPTAAPAVTNAPTTAPQGLSTLPTGNVQLTRTPRTFATTATMAVTVGGQPLATNANRTIDNITITRAATGALTVAPRAGAPATGSLLTSGARTVTIVVSAGSTNPANTRTFTLTN